MKTKTEKQPRKPPDIAGPDAVCAVVCEKLRVTPAQLRGGKHAGKSSALALQRAKVICALTDALPLLPQQAIADLLGLHVTAIGKALARLKASMENDADLAREVKRLTNAARRATKN